MDLLLVVSMLPPSALRIMVLTVLPVQEALLPPESLLRAIMVAQAAIIAALDHIGVQIAQPTPTRCLGGSALPADLAWFRMQDQLLATLPLNHLRPPHQTLLLAPRHPQQHLHPQTPLA
jgi:hypothetical protein